ncbi:MAG: hypothetical protein ACRYFX_28790 [Janthinobacterium lividum]
MPTTVIWQENGRRWLRQPGAEPGSVLSLHTQLGRRVRQVAQSQMELTDLPIGGYLLRVQLPDGTVHVLPVQLL